MNRLATGLLVILTFAAYASSQDLEAELKKLTELEEQLLNPPAKESVFLNPDEVKLTYHQWNDEAPFSSKSKCVEVNGLSIDPDLWTAVIKSKMNDLSGRETFKTFCAIRKLYVFEIKKGNDYGKIIVYGGCENFLHSSENSDGLIEAEPQTIILLKSLAEEAYNQSL